MDSNQMASIILLLQFILRIAGSVFCNNRAEKLNRGTSRWGWLGFFFPVVAMIWILCLRPNVKWEKI